jgi:hypothetical protein
MDAARRKDLYLKATIAAATYFAVFEIGYLAGTKPPFDPLHYLIGRDFVNTWMQGRAAFYADPGHWFDFAAYNAALHRQFGALLPAHNWSYPPSLFLFVWPLAFLPYLPAYAAWCFIGFAAYLHAADGTRDLHRIALLAAAPAVAINVFTGQNGFFTAALLVAGLSNRERRPLLAGVFFGLLTIKPQLALLIPVMLLVTRNWRALVAMGLTAACLVAASSAIFGVETWIRYWQLALPFQQHVMTDGTGLFVAMAPTLFMNARIAGLGTSAALALQLVFSAAALAAVVGAFAKRRDPLLSDAVLVTAMLVATPYAFGYDMVAFGWIVVRLAERTDGTVGDDRLTLAMWSLPVVGVVLGLAGIPGSALVPMGFLARLVWRLRSVEGAGEQAPRALPARFPSQS